ALAAGCRAPRRTEPARPQGPATIRQADRCVASGSAESPPPNGAIRGDRHNGSRRASGSLSEGLPALRGADLPAGRSIRYRVRNEFDRATSRYQTVQVQTSVVSRITTGLYAGRWLEQVEWYGR